MSTQVMRAGAGIQPPAGEAIGTSVRNDGVDMEGKGGMANAFAAVDAVGMAGAQTGNGAPTLTELTVSDALKLLSLWLPRTAATSSGRDIGLLDIVVPEEIARDSRRRIIFKFGMWAAHDLALDTGVLGTEDLMALGRQTVMDHITTGASDDVFIAMARAEGKVDDAAWAAQDKEKIAEQVDAFVQSEFKDEIELHKALGGLATEPPLLGRRELADALLREYGIDTDAQLGGHDISLEALKEGGLGYESSSISGSSMPLIWKWKAGEHYFNNDKLAPDFVRKMKMRGGGHPTEEQAARMLRELPASLDAEFTRRFDAHQRRMSTHLASWIAARLSLHAKETAIDLTGATVTISRAKMQLASPAGPLKTKYSELYGTRPSCGFLIAIHSANQTHRCFISNRTGAVHVLPPGEPVESWLKKNRELVFEDAQAYTQAVGSSRAWRFRTTVEEAVSGPYDVIRERLSTLFHAEIEPGREAARGMNPFEGMVDGFLNLIPFRAMVVALRKGDISAAIIMGGMDVLSVLPFIGTGLRLGGAALKSATPWLAMSMRFGGTAGRQGLTGGLRRLVGGIPYERLKGLGGSLGGSAIRRWGRLRLLDIQRVAAALRATSPKLSAMLNDIVARVRGATIPDGVWRVTRGATIRNGMWRVDGTAAAAATGETGDEITAISTVTARSLEGGELNLLPYSEWEGAYTQIDSTGERIGWLLLADSGGWLHQTMPLSSLRRYRICSLEIVSELAGKRVGPDGTLTLNGKQYVRLGPYYVEVKEDLSVSTASRRIWRVVAPEDITPDAITHRLVYNADEGLWHQANDVPGLAGGGQAGAKLSACARIAIGSIADWSVVPGTARLESYRSVLTAGMRDAKQVEVFGALWDRIGSDRRGRAIQRAMTTYYELHGQAPDIILREGADAVRSPSLDRPVRGNTWHLDLEALRFGTTESAVQELAAVYNNMTGLLQNEDPFAALLARGGPDIEYKLEDRWADWVLEEEDFLERGKVINRLSKQLREMRCYGGLDRSTFKSLLRNQPGTWDVKINLSFQRLTSIPPLPGDTEALILSHNPIQDWRNLPSGLRVLHAEHTQMLTLPPLPLQLEELNLSNNYLRDSALKLPPTLKRLQIVRNGLNRVPDLPGSLEELAIYENNIEELPAALPSGLRLLDVSNNALTRLPTDLSPNLKILYVGSNRLAELPDLSRLGLERLDVSSNHLQVLPALPDTLLALDASSNALLELPENLPGRLEILILKHNRITQIRDLAHSVLHGIDVSSNRLRALPALPDTVRVITADDNLLTELSGNFSRGLESLSVARNQLRRLPDNLPQDLRVLSVSGNAITELPANILTLESCEIYLDGNPIALEHIPDIPPDRAGPQFFLMVLNHGDEPGQAVRPLAQAVRYWWTQASEAQSRWDAIGMELGTQRDAMEFSLFLDRLRRTVSYQDEAFRAQVANWLMELSKPERKGLLQQTLRTCAGATESCNDRIISTWNDLQNLFRNDDIEHGIYDGRETEVENVARQMFRINELANIARDKERVLKKLLPPGARYVDQVEVYLAYAVQLRDSLDLTTIAPQMQYYRYSGVTEEDVVAARKTVLARERQEFDKFLVVDYEPWQTLLKRRDAKAYADAEAVAHQALEDRFESELQKALDAVKLDPADTAAVADARRNLGPGVMREIRYKAMAPLTRALRAGAGMGHTS